MGVEQGDRELSCTFGFKKIVAVSALGLVAILGTSEVANAQYRNNDYRQDRRISKQQERIEKQRAKLQRIRVQQQRQAELNRRNTQIYNGQVYNGNVYANTNRYRVNRNGAYYTTDQRGADLLRHAVNAGYQQGFQVGRNDRSGRRRISYSNSNIYQSGTYGYQSYVTQSQYQYYFRQGFQRGYQDGSNTRYQNDYNGQYQYGSNNNGVVSILGSILGSILNIQRY